MLNIESPFVLRKTYEHLATKFVALKEHRDKISREYTDLQEQHKNDQERITALHTNFEALANRSDAVTAENASLSIFALEALTWIEEIVLPANGKNRRELSKRREELREMARKLGIVEEDTQEEEEQSA